MALSFQEVVSDGSLSFIDVAFPYIKREHVFVDFDGSPTAPGVWTWHPAIPNRIVFAAAVPNGVQVRVKRQTAAAQVRHTYTLGAGFTFGTLDENFKQILFLSQEGKEQGFTVPGPDIELRENLQASGGSNLVGFQQAGAGAITRKVQAKLRESLNVLDYGAVGNGVADDTVAIQTAINAAYGKILVIPRGRYRLTSPLVIQPIFNGTSALPLQIVGEGFDANGGSGGTILSVEHTGDGIRMVNTNPEGADARFVLKGFLLTGDGADAEGGRGIYALKVNNLLISDVWVQNMRDTGVYFERCYGSALQDCVLLRNRRWGFVADKAWNLGHLLRVRAYHNGTAYSNEPVGNFKLMGAGDENLGVIFDNVDISYAGCQAFRLFRRSNNTLTNIVVTGGTAVATTSVAHGLVSGQLISLVSQTQNNLATTYPPACTVVSPTQFSWSTSAVNGVYNALDIIIGPASYGLFCTHTRGLVLKVYNEDCMGPAMYLGNGTISYEVQGGYWQGVEFNSNVIVDETQNGKLSGMYFTGPQARLIVANTQRKHNVNAGSNNTFAAGASVLNTTLPMREGVYYNNAAPSAGTWTVGDYVKQSNPVVGQPKGWYCTVAGTPGTWVSEGNL